MSKDQQYELTNKGSITFHDEDGNVLNFEQGDTVDASQLNQIPSRQQAFFTEVETEVKDEVEAEDEHENMTVQQLKDALIEEDIYFKSDARKDDLLALYTEHIKDA